MIRVLLVEDLPEVRGELRSHIDRDPDLTVVGEAENGLEAIALYRQLAPDVVSMNISMPTLDGLSASREICSQGEGARIVVVSVHLPSEYDPSFVEEMVIQWLPKPVDPAQYVETLKVAARSRPLKCERQALRAGSYLSQMSREVLSTVRESLPTAADDARAIGPPSSAASPFGVYCSLIIAAVAARSRPGAVPYLIRVDILAWLLDTEGIDHVVLNLANKHPTFFDRLIGFAQRQWPPHLPINLWPCWAADIDTFDVVPVCTTDDTRHPEDALLEARRTLEEYRPAFAPSPEAAGGPTAIWHALNNLLPTLDLADRRRDGGKLHSGTRSEARQTDIETLARAFAPPSPGNLVPLEVLRASYCEPVLERISQISAIFADQLVRFGARRWPPSHIPQEGWDSWAADIVKYTYHITDPTLAFRVPPGSLQDARQVLRLSRPKFASVHSRAQAHLAMFLALRDLVTACDDSDVL